MSVWLVRAGAHGEREDVALSNGLAVIGWDELSDLTAVQASRDGLMALLAQTYGDAKRARLANWAGQIWAFMNMKQGDLVVLPLKTRAALAFGTVAGPYAYRADLPLGARHTRPVKWIKDDVPRSALRQDLLHSLGAFMTVCRISRNDAEARIKRVLEGKPDAEWTAIGAPPDGVTDELGEPQRDLEQDARDQITGFISRNYRGQALVRLVAGILRAQGYYVEEGPWAGADAGIDAIAGRGPLGFDPPRIAVQVKTSDQPLGSSTLRELQGSMKNFGAEQGLLIAWGGFKATVMTDARKLGFEVRLWDQGKLINALTEHYDLLPDELKAELPLKRIWTIVAPDIENRGPELHA